MFPSVSVNPDNPYERMLDALKNQELFRVQVQAMADQNKALQDRINELNATKTSVEKQSYELEQQVADLKKQQEDLDSKLGLQERNRAELDTATAALNKREVDLLARERKQHDDEQDLADKVKELSKQQDAASAYQATAEKLQQEALKLKALYEGKLEYFKHIP